MSSANKTAAARLVEALSDLRVDLVFGLPGVHNLSIWSALAGSEIRLVGVRHEQTAAYAADGFARRTGKLGVAVVTSGPGAANAVCATGEAMASSSPVLVIATDIPSNLRRENVHRGVLHETRGQAALFASVTKCARDVRGADEVADAVIEAASLALAPNAGPVYLGIPTDLLSQPALAPRRRGSSGSPSPSPAAATLRAASDLLVDAKRPLVWAGGGAVRAEAGDAVGELACRLGAPVITTYMSRGLLGSHPCAVPGPVHDPAVGELWDDADVVLAIGTDFDGMMTQNWRMPAPPQLVGINVDPDEVSKNYTCDVELIGDARAVVGQLLDLVPQDDRSADVAARLAPVSRRVQSALERDDPQAAAFLDAMERALPPGTAVVADMCVPGYWLAGYRRTHTTRGFACPLGWGTLGFAFPASLGSACAGHGPTVCVTGDGGFLFACGDLATAAQEQIPITIVLVDDRGYGMLRFDQQHAGETPFGVDFAPIDFVALATAFGVTANAVGDFGATFEAAVRAGVESQEPNLIVVEALLKPPLTTSPRWYRSEMTADRDREPQVRCTQVAQRQNPSL